MFSRRHRAAAVLLTGTFTLTALSACSGDDGEKDTSRDWSEAGPKAADLLDETSGVTLRLSTDDDPGVDYLSSATGTVIAEPPAFEGTVNGSVSGIPVTDVPVISVDDTMWINYALLGGWSDQFKPADLCAPDPALLLDPDAGISTVLTGTEDVKTGKRERGGKDNKETFQTYSGTATGDAVRSILPCAEGDAFDATYTVDDDGRLRTARLTGVFFPDAESVTYTIDVTEYGVTKDITAPR
ncbi:LppX_LprAFG lipoprotein [Nocardioides sp. zg-536]|uniref:LppX_LprAFG lipoprotein n=1 Tax=Nocardioides faecalis TaxID=2803858 RepID=A0A939BT31_9ACTN|nr:LppX_LprAFG lipoprotein [Nocardioides faecalis]MBM9460239.1 LppX_LprAFG lipoprotein [Nocardioides faecalis]QVI59973.1 LppX_LprAFG lipoprotein [Nocardioides faecalis]